MTKLTTEEELDHLINYGVKEGYIDDSAADWTAEQRQKYFDLCNSYSPENE
jgi:hypothetical protein